MSMIAFSRRDRGITWWPVFDSVGNVIDTAWDERTVIFTVDSMKIMDLYHAGWYDRIRYSNITSPYYIVSGDSLQVYRAPGYPANCYTDECLYNGHTIGVIEWTWDTVFLYIDDYYYYFEAFVRETDNKK